MEEQFQWPEYPGISVLVEPKTGRQVALLIYEWDPESGTGIQRADIRCGKPDLSDMSEGIQMTRPFLKRGSDWTGLVIEDDTNEAEVYHLLDKAVEDCAEWNFSITLDDSPKKEEQSSDEKKRSLVFHGTSIPPRRVRSTAPADRTSSSAHYTHTFKNPDVPIKSSQTNKGQDTLSTPNEDSASHISNTVSDDPTVISSGSLQIPVEIMKMRQLYQYGNYSFEEKCRNFLRQGKFMENYEDNAPWNGYFIRFFPTYHDLNLPQLRGYFTWRAEIRRGTFHPIATSLAYIYLYELLNGIGASSPEDSLKKMREFETGFLDSGIGDISMKKNLHRWMFEFSIMKNLPIQTVRSCADPDIVRQDEQYAVLRNPDAHTDEEIFSALSSFDKDKISTSSAITKTGDRGRHLFASVWREAQKEYVKSHDTDLFTALFGKRLACVWHPLGNAIFLEETPHPDTSFILDESRQYHCQSGNWYETRYEALYFDHDRLHGFLHETDRLLRRYLKTGHYLRQKESEAWADPFINAVIQKDIQEIKEAARPKISIDFSQLGQIRSDAAITRDSLLTEEEKGAPPDSGLFAESAPAVSFTAVSVKEPETFSYAQSHPSQEASSSDIDTDAAEESFDGLDAMYLQILKKLLRGESIDADIKAHHLMPSVVTDTINEALFDEIGDSVLECNDDRIELVEDYREDVKELLGVS